MASAEKVVSKLEAQALNQFDSLLAKGELFWSESEEIEIKQEPFNVFLRVSENLTKKPYNPGNKKPGFLDEDPEFTLCNIEPNHKLILNKFCWVRPQMILHTQDFQSQTDLLYLPDFQAAVDVLNRLGDRYMVIFNGGPDAGSSVAHKHLQIFLKPDWDMITDQIIQGRSDVSLPFEYRLTEIPTSRSPDVVYEFYKQMCEEMKITPGRAHGLLLTKEWIMVVPRSCANIKGDVDDAPLQGGANAMIGMLWLKSNAQLENWKRYGPMKALIDFGVASSTGSSVQS